MSYIDPLESTDINKNESAQIDMRNLVCLGFDADDYAKDEDYKNDVKTMLLKNVTNKYAFFEKYENNIVTGKQVE